jgi:26S proteasome non-ATPase regulatory subunit 10
LEQDDSGWTPLMIAASVKDGEKIVDLLLSKGADVNEKSEFGKTSV